MTEDKLVGWHHRLDGVSLSKLRKIVEDRGALRAAVCGAVELDTTERLNSRREARGPLGPRWSLFPVSPPAAPSHVAQAPAALQAPLPWWSHLPLLVSAQLPPPQ